MSKLDTVWDRFCNDVPENERDDVLLMISEAAHGANIDGVTILVRDRVDAINVRACGSVVINGVEYAFQCESGNCNGFVLESWEDDTIFEEHKPTVWTLAPKDAVVSKHLLRGTQRKLLMVWDAFMKRADVADIPRNYMYDKHFAPGLKTESYWKSKAELLGMELVVKEHADQIRAALSAPSDGVK